jgi:hypothetical protein
MSVTPLVRAVPWARSVEGSRPQSVRDNLTTAKNAKSGSVIPSEVEESLGHNRLQTEAWFASPETRSPIAKVRREQPRLYCRTGAAEANCHPDADGGVSQDCPQIP